MEPKTAGITLPRWAKVLIGIVTVVLLGLGTVYLMGIVERGRWQHYAASLREAGEPLTFEEIEARRAELPDERNSALVIEAALRSFPPYLNPPPFVLILGSHPPDDDLFVGIPRYAIDESRTFLDAHRDLLDALRPVLDMSAGRLAVAHAKNPIDTLLPNLTGMRTVSKLARLDAILRLIDGDLNGAVNATVMQLHIAGSLNEYPMLIGHLVEVSCDRLGLQTAEDVLRAGEVTEGALVRLDNALTARRQTNPMRWSMWSERAFSAEYHDLLATGEVPLDDLLWGSPTPAPPSRLLPEFIVRKNQILAVRMLTRLVDAGDDVPAMRDAAVQMETDINKLGGTYFLVKMMLPSLSRAVYLQIERDAVLDCALVGIAAERYRLANRRWPASLDELVPAYLEQVPPDPFAKGRSLTLVITDQGITIYSIGEDTIDDGGDVVAGENARVGPDLGFRLLDPEHRRMVITDEPPPDEGD